MFARGTAKDRGKAVAVGTVKRPAHIFLRVRHMNRAAAPYVEWRLTCTNGVRTETTTDQGTASLPLYIELPIGIKGATSCTATASAVSLHAANVDISGTLSVELLNKP